MKYVIYFLMCMFAISAQAQEQAKLTTESTQKPAFLETFAYGLFKPVPSQPYWYVQTSIYTEHFNPKPYHNNNQELIMIDRHRDDSYLWGAGTFLNSFSQRSVMAYVGKRYDFGNSPFYGRIALGLIHGYRGEYKRKVPMNDLGIAPAVIPTLGVKVKRVHADASLLGLNAYIITLGVRI